MLKPTKTRNRSESPQPIEVAQLPDALLKIQTVRAVVGISDSAIRRGVREGTFPKPIRMGERCTRWLSADVSAWVRERVAKA